MFGCSNSLNQFTEEIKEMKKIWAFIKDEEGMETVEWAVLAALIVVGLVTAITGLGGNVLAAFEELETATTGTTAP
jgi:Flp pilus assembly pilin Flp